MSEESKQEETTTNLVGRDASRDDFVGEIAGGYVSKQGLPSNPEEAVQLARRIYDFADALLYVRAEREAADRIAEQEHAVRQTMSLRQQAMARPFPGGFAPPPPVQRPNPARPTVIGTPPAGGPQVLQSGAVVNTPPEFGVQK